MFGWAEDERTGEPVPIDAVGGMTASVSFQPYGKVGYSHVFDALEADRRRSFLHPFVPPGLVNLVYRVLGALGVS